MNRRSVMLAALVAFLALTAAHCPPRTPPDGCAPAPNEPGRGFWAVGDTVETDAGGFELTSGADGLALGGVPLERGVVRSANVPFLYVHQLLDDGRVELTLDLCNSKTEWEPLYADSPGSLGDLGTDDPHRWWPTDRWGVAQLDRSRRHWLVANRDTEGGFLVDLVRRDSLRDWELVAADFLIPDSGEAVVLPTTALRLRLDRAVGPGGSRHDAVKFLATPVLFVHGHSAGPDLAFKSTLLRTSFAAALRANGQLGLEPVYLELPRFGAGRPSTRSIARDAVDIGAKIEEILDARVFEGIDRVPVIAYSQGTLSSRIYLNGGLDGPPDPGGPLPPVSELVTLAAPNHGLAAAEFADEDVCGDPNQADRSRRELCGGRLVTSDSLDAECGECGGDLPPEFSIKTMPGGAARSEEESFFFRLNGHELHEDCDAPQVPGEAPHSRSPGESVGSGVLYVNLWAVGDEMVGGGERPEDCTGRGLPLNHAPDAVNLRVPGLFLLRHTNLPHYWPAICVALKTVVDHRPPLSEGENVTEAAACQGLTRP